MNSILENIDTIRRNRGYSQEYLAMQIGMKQAGFSLIMSGERELKYNTLLQIANALQMSVIDVITFPDKYVMAKGNGTSTEAVLQIKLLTEYILRHFMALQYRIEVSVPLRFGQNKSHQIFWKIQGDFLQMQHESLHDTAQAQINFFHG